MRQQYIVCAILVGTTEQDTFVLIVNRQSRMMKITLLSYNLTGHSLCWILKMFISLTHCEWKHQYTSLLQLLQQKNEKMQCDADCAICVANSAVMIINDTVYADGLVIWWWTSFPSSSLHWRKVTWLSEVIQVVVGNVRQSSFIVCFQVSDKEVLQLHQVECLQSGQKFCLSEATVLWVCIVQHFPCNILPTVQFSAAAACHSNWWICLCVQLCRRDAVQSVLQLAHDKCECEQTACLMRLYRYPLWEGWIPLLLFGSTWNWYSSDMLSGNTLITAFISAV